MDKEIISSEVIYYINNYAVIKVKEIRLDAHGKPFGRYIIWYDVCAENGEGDIVASYHTIKDARKWAKEN